MTPFSHIRMPIPSLRAMRVQQCGSEPGAAMTAFRRSESGGIAILFAVVIAVTIGLVGFAVDSGTAMFQKQQLQATADSAALAAARTEFAHGDTAATVDQFIATNWTLKHPGLPATIEEFSVGDGAVKLKLRVETSTTFSKVLGFHNFDLNVYAQANYGVDSIEIALALDNTFSMEGAKIDALKSAAHTLVTTVTSIPDATSKVKIGLVPFGQYVNIGTVYRGSDWLAVDDDSSTTTNVCSTQYDVSTSNCHDVTESYLRDGVPQSYTHSVCDTTYSNPHEVCADQTATHTWFGCVGSRNDPLDLSPDVSAGAPVPGLMDVSGWGCPSPLTRLTNDFADINNKIDGMTASTDQTYIPPGILWGWRVLSHGSPFADGKDPATDPNVRKILVLMTDGANTRSPSYPTHDGGDVAAANTLTSQLCTSAKLSGIRIYTVSFQVTDAATISMLSDCASNPLSAFTADSSSELEAAFEKIGGDIIALRLAK